ncbi:MAG: hypothetical protein K6U09_00310 [Acidobacteriia bacterium]|jgi:hypothetical protein|nr:hypothetical protein [Terriglobia bacterium]
MKLTRLFPILVLALAIGAGVSVAQKDVTLEGTLVDSKCYLSVGEADNDHGTMKNCGTMCLKGGSPAGLLTRDKKFHAIIAPSTALADFVGQTIRVQGSEHNGSIMAKKVEVRKNGRWEEVKLGAMM